MSIHSTEEAIHVPLKESPPRTPEEQRQLDEIARAVKMGVFDWGNNAAVRLNEEVTSAEPIHVPLKESPPRTPEEQRQFDEIIRAVK